MTEENEYSRAKFLRLQNGDDIVSEVVEMEDEDGIVYLIINPLKVIYVPTASGSLQVAFMPWVFSKIVDKQQFMIHLEDVLMIVDVSDYMNKYYWENITSYFTNEASHTKEEEIEEVSDSEEDSSLLEALRELSTKRIYH
jgi:hypothetical protein